MPERRYLLDTNILSDLIRNPEGLVFHRIAEVSESSVCTSIIVACEFRYGAFKKNAPNLTRKVEQLLGVLKILPLRPETDHHYARIRTHLERNGTPVGENDLLIVGQTLTEGLVLVTANTNEFSRVRAWFWKTGCCRPERAAPAVQEKTELMPRQ